MTILTKPNFVPKAPEENPSTVENGENPILDQGSDNDKLFLLRLRSRRAVSMSSILLILATICLLCLAMMTGLVIYRRAQVQRMHFRGYCGFPYTDSQTEEDRDALTELNRVYQSLLTDMENFQQSEKLFQTDSRPTIFRQSFELRDDDQNEYSDIYVPEFGNGRVGRFVHDFKNNQTGIVDETKRRCFVMPLDRSVTMPPKSMADLIQKLYSGYYEVNTTAVRKNMRVVTPALTDLRDVSPKIQNVCESMDVYRLEAMTGRVFKRSIGSLDSFESFAGSQLVQYRIDTGALDE